jgi:phosphopantetheinyl transferase
MHAGWNADPSDGLVIRWQRLNCGDTDVPALEDCLSAAERARLAAFPAQKRRVEWLLGRRAAKDLVRSLLVERLAYDVPLTAIEVTTSESGAPKIVSAAASLPWPEGAPVPIEISISHSSGVAVSAGCWRPENLPRVSVGIDLERITPHDPSIFRDIFTVEEERYRASGSDLSSDERAMLVWSGKESVLKALGQGFTVDPQSVTCLPLSQPPGDAFHVEPCALWRSLDVRCAAGLVPPASRISGRWWLQEGFAFTLAVLQGDRLR